MSTTPTHPDFPTGKVEAAPHSSADSSARQAAEQSSTGRPPRLALLWRELGAFGVIGVLNIFVDMGLFNLLVAGPLANKVTTAKIISGAVATVFAWIGNRYWTFKHRENRPVHHELALFVIVNAIALAATAGWVAFAHYVLHATGTLWINFHALVGIGIGTVIRFLAYRFVVFNANPSKK